MILTNCKPYLYCYCLIILVGACRDPAPSVPVLPEISEHELPAIWANMTLHITQHTPANSPTFASRAFGYIGLTMYESVVHGFAGKNSLSGQLNDMPPLPIPEEDKQYNWALSLNASQAYILKQIYQQTSDENKRKIDSLESVLKIVLGKEAADEIIINRSIAFGQEVASVIFEWSKEDGGHRGYLKNFDVNFVQKSDRGNWRPPFFAQTISRLPLHPNWGENRTLLVENADWYIPPFLPYDSLNSSQYFQEFHRVYDHNTNLSQEQKEIAMWWNDDPGETATPPGHSYNLVTLVVGNKNSDMITAAEAYARVGLAVADAFVVCWKMKYHYFSERPSTYISEYIDDEWEPFWPDPPFPAFPSGHATQAAAVATVLSDVFGEKLDFVDVTHSKRKKDKLRNVEYKERHFNSFWEVAEETAYSRFLGGIHSEYDNVIGLQEGKKVGEHVNSLKWDN
ncbi:vanadium-dependent haloperoxidase [Lunatibacter salilacus]|uniref:vanadium-dependent haloperoxidase n=1 Tax=Lunatibacter salilacus TaxID=2483804 RepID=UPI00131C2010|nr:vanadium-dependent haloperoxidase [Lunatibacter salilacus]